MYYCKKESEKTNHSKTILIRVNYLNLKESFIIMKKLISILIIVIIIFSGMTVCFAVSTPDSVIDYSTIYRDVDSKDDVRDVQDNLIGMLETRFVKGIFHLSLHFLDIKKGSVFFLWRE